nr:hypothetical protein [Tanacetum cinerariifolium]
EESSEDEEDDEMDVEADEEEEEEEHQTPADSIVTKRHLLDGRLNMFFRDRRAHAYTRLLMEAEARMSREAWT